jgi:hypothetical protein
MNADLDAVSILPNDGLIDLAGDDDEVGTVGALGWMEYAPGDNGALSELVQRVGAMIKDCGGSFDFNNVAHRAQLGGLIGAHDLTREVRRERRTSAPMRAPLSARAPLSDKPAHDGFVPVPRLHRA